MSAATLRRLIVIGLIAMWEILPRTGLIIDRIAISLPRPRTYEMMATDVFGRLRDRIWQQIRKSA